MVALALLLGGCSASHTVGDRAASGVARPPGAPVTTVIDPGGAFEATPLPLYVPGSAVVLARPWRGQPATASAGDLTSSGDELLRPAQG
jgi:hypothetical protein